MRDAPAEHAQAHRAIDALRRHEFHALTDALRLGQAGVFHCAGAGLLGPDRGRQALAALATTVADDLTAALRRHARTEAVAAETGQVMRLVRALHGNT